MPPIYPAAHPSANPSIQRKRNSQKTQKKTKSTLYPLQPLFLTPPPKTTSRFRQLSLTPGSVTVRKKWEKKKKKGKREVKKEYPFYFISFFVVSQSERICYERGIKLKRS
jgi:hypothetical protein